MHENFERATDVLREEHKAIKKMLDVLERICEKLENGEHVDPEHMREVIEFIKTFADKCHHGKEEDILFPELEKIGIPKEGGPIGVMLHEHNLGREFVGEMSDAIEAYEKGDAESARKFVENARGYIGLLRDHIEKEDNILYPMGEMHLSEEKMKELIEKFDHVENQIVGGGVHEKMHELLHKLEKIYLHEGHGSCH